MGWSSTQEKIDKDGTKKQKQKTPVESLPLIRLENNAKGRFSLDK